MTAPRGRLPPVCVLAGGLGSRLGALTRDTPKPLLAVAGRPFAEYQLELLRRHGAGRVVFCVGYRGELFEQVLGDGSRFDLDVRYSCDGEELAGTAGAIRGALALLGDSFLVLYGDTFLRIDYGAVAEAFARAGTAGLMTVLHDDDGSLPCNVRLEGDRVAAYDKKTRPHGAEWIDYGLSAYRAEVFARPGPSDLAEVQGTLAAAGELAAFVARHRYYEIGSPEALRETEHFLRSYLAVGES
ncbi:MAG: N-acetyl-alpha-D-muramate 1-phosphate uridylyltransferase [Gaiellales bacterium]|nr:N-acetyl-alpha-D-muramate 1-phosphate uridylyltransferase [Gaiellales bacterium]